MDSNLTTINYCVFGIFSYAELVLDEHLKQYNDEYQCTRLENGDIVINNQSKNVNLNITGNENQDIDVCLICLKISEPIWYPLDDQRKILSLCAEQAINDLKAITNEIKLLNDEAKEFSFTLKPIIDAMKMLTDKPLTVTSEEIVEITKPFLSQCTIFSQKLVSIETKAFYFNISLNQAPVWFSFLFLINEFVNEIKQFHHNAKPVVNQKKKRRKAVKKFTNEEQLLFTDAKRKFVDEIELYLELIKPFDDEAKSFFNNKTSLLQTIKAATEAMKKFDYEITRFVAAMKEVGAEDETFSDAINECSNEMKKYENELEQFTASVTKASSNVEYYLDGIIPEIDEWKEDAENLQLFTDELEGFLTKAKPFIEGKESNNLVRLVATNFKNDHPKAAVILACIDAENKFNPRVKRQYELAGMKMLNRNIGNELANEIGAVKYIEYSRKTGRGAKILVDEIIYAGLSKLKDEREHELLSHHKKKLKQNKTCTFL